MCCAVFTQSQHCTSFPFILWFIHTLISSLRVFTLLHWPILPASIIHISFSLMLSLSHVLFVCIVCVCVYTGVLRPGFMHERAHMLDWAEKIPEIMQLIPVSRCYSEQIKMFCTVSVIQVFDFPEFPQWLISSSSTNPQPQVPSVSEMYWFTVSITVLTRTLESRWDSFYTSVRWNIQSSHRWIRLNVLRSDKPYMLQGYICSRLLLWSCS